MHTAFFRRASLSATLLMLAAGPVWAQGTDNGSQAVYSQTIRGVTVHLLRAGWDAVEPGNAAFSFYKTFSVSYAIRADTRLPLPPHKSLLDFVTDVAAVSPSGYPLSTGGSGRSSNSSGTTAASARWDDIDPRWPLVAIDVDFLDPAAPPKATGRSVSPITISGIPVPPQPDVETPVHAETITPLGTKMIVESVKVSPDAKGMKTTFALRIIPDPAAPDLRFNYSTGTKVMDDAGVSFSPRGGSATGPTTGPATRTVSVFGAPNPGAKMLSLTLDATEESERLKQDGWYRHFHLLVPLRPLNTSGRPHPVPPLATVQGKDAVATLDSLGSQWGRYRTRIILRDRSDPNITWRLRKIYGKDEQGNALSGVTGNGEFFWKTDGSPLLPGESSAEIFVGAPGNPNGPWGVREAPPGAKTLSLQADVYAFREDYHVLDFPKIPIPAPGQTLSLNRRVQAAPGVYLVLRKIASFSPDHPLPAGFDYPNRTFLVPPSSPGLAVVLAEPPDPKGTTRFDFGVVAANDPTGRHLLPVQTLTYAPGDALSGAAPPPPNDPARVATFFFRTPAPGAQTFNLRMDRDVKVRLDRQETLTFPDLPAPAINAH